MLFIYYFVLLYCIYDMSICMYIECEFPMSSCTPVCLRLYKYNLVLSCLDKLYHIMLYRVPRMSEVGTHNFVVIGTDCIGSCKSSYYAITITTTTAPVTLELYICFIIERIFFMYF
jgi:hypothetical protein